MTKPFTVYLAGCMTGWKDYNFPAFHYAAEQVRAVRLPEAVVHNPAENHGGRTDLSWQAYMATALRQVLDSSVLLLLPNWETSVGARLERDVALAAGIQAHPIEEFLSGLDPERLRGQPDSSVVTAGHPAVPPTERWKIVGVASDFAPTFDSDEMPRFPKVASSETILQEAQRLVHGDRGKHYGHPLDDFSRTAKIWSAILGNDITAQQVALCMVGVKISREVNSPQRDNRTDGAGYFETLDMVESELERRGWSSPSSSGAVDILECYAVTSQTRRPQGHLDT